MEYLSGQVQADFLDSLSKDLIATERQRIDWEDENSRPVLEWGQERVKQLLEIWRDRRGEKRAKQLEEKLAGFSSRLEKLKPHERKTVRSAIRKVAQIPTLNDEQFSQLGGAMMTAWEQGRLRDLIHDMSEADSVSENEFLNLLIEAEVLTALNTAEAVKTKLQTIGGLKLRIQQRKRENKIRDYISENPWLISPEWETFRAERQLNKVVQEAAKKAEFLNEEYEGRVDLVLASGDHLLVLEFMRPNLTLNWDHVQRFNLYVRTIRRNVMASSGGTYNRVTGYLIADRLERDAAVLDEIESLRRDDMYALDWDKLLGKAVSAWDEFLETLVDRAPDDERLQALLEDRR